MTTILCTKYVQSRWSLILNIVWYKLAFQELPYVKSKRNVTDRYAVGSLEDFEGYCIDILREITKKTGWLTYFFIIKIQ